MYDSLHNAAEDLEAGTTRKPKFQTEPTLPIYLKVFLPSKYLHKLYKLQVAMFAMYDFLLPLPENHCNLQLHLPVYVQNLHVFKS